MHRQHRAPEAKSWCYAHEAKAPSTIGGRKLDQGGGPHRLAFLETNTETLLLHETGSGIDLLVPDSPDVRTELVSMDTKTGDCPQDAVVSPNKKWVVWWERSHHAHTLWICNTLTQEIEPHPFPITQRQRIEELEISPTCAFDESERRLRWPPLAPQRWCTALI